MGELLVELLLRHRTLQPFVQRWLVLPRSRFELARRQRRLSQFRQQDLVQLQQRISREEVLRLPLAVGVNLATRCQLLGHGQRLRAQLLIRSRQRLLQRRRRRLHTGQRLQRLQDDCFLVTRQHRGSRHLRS